MAGFFFFFNKIKCKLLKGVKEPTMCAFMWGKRTNYRGELSVSIQAPSLVLMHHTSSLLRIDASATPLLCLTVEWDLQLYFTPLYCPWMSCFVLLESQIKAVDVCVFIACVYNANLTVLQGITCTQITCTAWLDVEPYQTGVGSRQSIAKAALFVCFQTKDGHIVGQNVNGFILCVLTLQNVRWDLSRAGRFDKTIAISDSFRNHTTGDYRARYLG